MSATIKFFCIINVLYFLINGLEAASKDPPGTARIRYSPSKVVKGGPVNLTCTIDSTGISDKVSYIWYRGSHVLPNVTQSVYSITSAGLETRNNFSCRAANEGGKGELATVFVKVYAAPAFKKKPPNYQGILYTSKHVNLTCIVECYPECSIVWHKDGIKLDNVHNRLYTVETHFLNPNPQKNDFESVNSTLIWNITAWPGYMLNKTSPNSNYTCEATSNKIGLGVSSTAEIAVDYPPEYITTSIKVVNVKEGDIPEPVKCYGKGRPPLTYQWKKDYMSDAISTNNILVLPKLTRNDTAAYICEASNKYGSKTATVYFNIQYAPECTITTVDKNGTPALVCTALGNPQEMTFVWIVKEGNETFNKTNNIIQDAAKSYLLLESSIETNRTYSCVAQNAIGHSGACKLEVAVVPGPAKITYLPLIPVKRKSVILYCNIESDKTLDNISYRWFRGQHLLPVNTSVLSIDPLTLDSRSNYTCNAFNEAGEGKTDTLFLDVKAPPTFIKVPPRFVEVMYTASNLYLTCIVECYPLCSISWLKNGELLQENPDLYLIESQNIPASIIYKDFEATYSKLNVNMTTSASKVDRNDIAGNYTCVASANSVGQSIRATSEVFVRGEQAARCVSMTKEHPI